jgi:hypothetical protein
MSPKRVGFLIYPAMQALDLVGPMDAFWHNAIRRWSSMRARSS